MSSDFISDDNINFSYHWRIEQKGAADFDNQDPHQVFSYAIPYLPKINSASPRGFVPHVLEIGCGIAKWSPLWRKLGYIYDGMDGSKDALEVAARRYGNASQWYLCRVEEMNISNMYDVVFSHAFMQHTNLEHKQKMLPKIHKALTDIGILMIQENCQDGNTATTFTREGWIQLIEPYGYRCLTTDEKTNGFVFERI